MDPSELRIQDSSSRTKVNCRSLESSSACRNGIVRGVEAVYLWTFRSLTEEATDRWEVALLLVATLSWDTAIRFFGDEKLVAKGGGVRHPNGRDTHVCMGKIGRETCVHLIDL